MSVMKKASHTELCGVFDRLKDLVKKNGMHLVVRYDRESSSVITSMKSGAFVTQTEILNCLDSSNMVSSVCNSIERDFANLQEILMNA